MKKNKSRQNNPCLSNSESAMRFVGKVDCDTVKKVVCAFRSHADPGLQAKLVQKIVQKSMLFFVLVFMKILVRFGVPFGVPFW